MIKFVHMILLLWYGLIKLLIQKTFHKYFILGEDIRVASKVLLKSKVKKKLIKMIDEYNHYSNTLKMAYQQPEIKQNK